MKASRVKDRTTRKTAKKLRQFWHVSSYLHPRTILRRAVSVLASRRVLQQVHVQLDVSLALLSLRRAAEPIQKHNQTR